MVTWVGLAQIWLKLLNSPTLKLPVGRKDFQSTSYTSRLIAVFNKLVDSKTPTLLQKSGINLPHKPNYSQYSGQAVSACFCGKTVLYYC